MALCISTSVVMVERGGAVDVIVKPVVIAVSPGCCVVVELVGIVARSVFDLGIAVRDVVARRG